MSSLLKLPGIKNFYQRYIQKRSDYLKGNRDEVLILYRKLRKAIPPTIDRELAKQGKIAVKIGYLLYLILQIGAQMDV